MADAPSARLPASSPAPATGSHARIGFTAAVAAYLTWGLFPLFFRALRPATPLEILAHRVVWSVALLALLVTWQRRWRDLRPAVAGPGLRPYLASTALISGNWLLFIWAVHHGRVLEASLGYFVNPLVNVVLGVLFLRERLTALQRVAVALATAGVLALALRLGHPPWVSLALALSFGLYGLVRKAARIDPTLGLLVETALLAPPALAYLLWLGATGAGVFGGAAGPSLLLASSGVVTAVPLIWFAVGMRSLRLSTMGLVQYLTPTCQFLLAVALFRERFGVEHAVAFGCIWCSLALYSREALRGRRAAEPELLD